MGKATLYGALTRYTIANLKRQPIGDAVQPVGDRFAPSQDGCLASQNEKGSLKGILGIVIVAQDSTTDSKNHRSMPVDQSAERVLVVVVDKSRQELAIRFACGLR
jgi:hypothetical protein